MRATKLSIAAIACFALTAGLSAQTCSPEHFKNSEATYYGYQPFGQSNTSGFRYLQIHDDLKDGAMTVRSIAFRRDSDSEQGAYMSYNLRLSMFLSTAATTSAAPSGTFDSNHGSNRTQVLSNKVIDFPSTIRGYVPMPFDYQIKLDTPFSFDGKGPLCWEVQVMSAQNVLTTVRFDQANSRSTNPPLAWTSFGSGCRHTTRAGAMDGGGSSSMRWSSKVGELRLTGSNLPASAIAIAVIGFSRTSFGPFPLPLMFPGSDKAITGACFLHVSPDLLYPISTNSSGAATLYLPIPAETTMNGLRIWGQWLAPDPASGNIFNLVASNGVEFNWVAPFDYVPLAYVLANNSVAPTGSVVKTRGYVTLLQ